MSRIHSAYVAGFLCLICLFGCGGGDKVQTPTNGDGEMRPPDSEQPERPQPPGISPGTERWRVNTVGGAGVRPVVSEDGTIYAASAGYVYAISPEGKKRWVANMSESLRSIHTLALDAEGRVYFVGGSRYGPNFYLYALDPKTYGAQMWRAEVTRTPITRKPVLIGSDGTVYAGAYGFGPEGTERWHREGVVVLGLDTRQDGDVIYARTVGGGGVEDTLFAFSPDGSELWRQVYKLWTPVTVGPEGTLYIGMWAGGLAGFAVVIHALDAGDGTSRWSVRLNGEMDRAVLLDEYGTIYAGTSRGVSAIGPDSTELWSFDTEERVTGSPVVDLDGILYFGAGRWLYAVWSDDGSEAWSVETEGNIGGVALGPEGVLYFGSSRGYVCAVMR